MDRTTTFGIKFNTYVHHNNFICFRYISLNRVVGKNGKGVHKNNHPLENINRVSNISLDSHKSDNSNIYWPPCITLL